MTQSMTAFARSEAEFSWGTLVWEIRSVNQRFLEPHFKLPDFMRQHEIAIRDKLRKRLARGKVECMLRFHESVGQQSVQVDQVRLQQVAEALRHIQLSGASEGSVDPLALLQFPGVMNSTSTDPNEVGRAALSLFDEVLAQLIEGRQREGVELAGLIEDRLQKIAAIVREIRSKMPHIIESQKANLVDRVAQLGVDLDAERLEQEVVLPGLWCWRHAHRPFRVGVREARSQEVRQHGFEVQASALQLPSREPSPLQGRGGHDAA